jgi:hypothetical protein
LTAIAASPAIVFMLRAVPAFAPGFSVLIGDPVE